MKGTVLHGPGDVRVESRDEKPTDAIIRLAATCICGSDLWPYSGIEPVKRPLLMGHEYVGIVEEVGSAVRNVKAGDFVVGSFVVSDNSCEICRSVPVALRERRVRLGDDRHAGRVRAHPARGRHARRHTRSSVDGAGREPARRIGRAGHRLVRGRCGGSGTGEDGRRRRRRRGGFVGVSHGVELPGLELFFAEATCTAARRRCGGICRS